MTHPSTADQLRRAPAAVQLEEHPDGSIVLRSPMPLLPYARCVGDYLHRWAKEGPERVFLAERSAGEWREIRYGETLDMVRTIAAHLLDRGLSADQPLMILSGNGINHALLSLAAMHIGIPVVPVSTAYSLLSKDFAKLKAIVSLTQPRMIYAAEGERYTKALEAVSSSSVEVIFDSSDSSHSCFSDLLTAIDTEQVDRLHADIGPDTIAKLLFTSGSTGDPKGVINTQRMLCSNQQAVFQAWPFLADEPPVMVDWLPWNHTYGGNYIFNMVLANGGSLYVDDGKPMPGLVEKTVENLTQVSPNIYCNVPRGFDMLVPLLERNEALRTSFFSKLKTILYASASLPPHIWSRLQDLALQEKGERMWMTSGWGATETAPVITMVHFDIERAGVIGLPLPGAELKMVPNAGKMELRVRGPGVTPGYWKRPDLTGAAFDKDGYYAMGDAGRFADPERPESGIEFDGRIAEDFKLMSGTWVHVGELRVKGIAALAPIAQDIVITGHERETVGFLVFASPDGVRSLCPDCSPEEPLEKLFFDPRVREKVTLGLSLLKADGGGSSMYANAALLMSEPPSIDANEITDKGYINQRAVLTKRSQLVSRLYDLGDADVIRNIS